MSIEAVDQVLKLGTEVDGSHRMILVVLANYADEDGWSYPKIETIAAKAGIKRRRTVTDSLTWLEDNGYIRRQVNCARGIRGNIPAGKRPNLYQLLFLDGVSESDRAPDQGASESDRGRGVGKRHPEPSSKNRQEPPPTPPRPRPKRKAPGRASAFDKAKQEAIDRGWSEDAIAWMLRELRADPTVRNVQAVAVHRLRSDDPPTQCGVSRPEGNVWSGHDGPDPDPGLNLAGIRAARSRLRVG